MLRVRPRLAVVIAGMTIGGVGYRNTHCRKIVRPRETRMSTQYTIVIEKDDDGYYVGSVPALPGCHSQGKSVDQLLERMHEAISLWLEVNGEDAPSPLELVGIQRIAV